MNPYLMLFLGIAKILKIFSMRNFYTVIIIIIQYKIKLININKQI